MPKMHVGLCARCGSSLANTKAQYMASAELDELLVGAPGFVREFVLDQKNKVSVSRCRCPGVVSFFPATAKTNKCAPIYGSMGGRWGVSRLCRCCESGPFSDVKVGPDM